MVQNRWDVKFLQIFHKERTQTGIGVEIVSSQIHNQVKDFAVGDLVLLKKTAVRGEEQRVVSGVPKGCQRTTSCSHGRLTLALISSEKLND